MERHPQILRMPAADALAATVVRRSATRTISYMANLPEELAVALWNEPEEMIAAGKRLRRTKFREAVLIEWASQKYVMKRYFELSSRHIIKRLLGRSQAGMSYQIGRVLARSGVRTPCPVACVENRRRGLQSDSYLVYPHVEGRTLRDSINLGYMSDAEINVMWGQLETLWDRLAALRVGLHDANTGNFIVTPNRVVWLIDLDDARLHRSSVIARTHLLRRWYQLYRSVRRARRTRDRQLQHVTRAA